MTQLLIDKAWKYLSYPLMEAKIFILSCNVEIKKYRLQQVDIGIRFRLSIWVHRVISSCLLHAEPLWMNEWMNDISIWSWTCSSMNEMLINYQILFIKSTFQHYEAFRYFGLREMIFFMKNLWSRDENEGPHSQFLYVFHVKSLIRILIVRVRN